MADLLAILSQGASSLGAHRVATATASHNLENVNTPGYSRQSVELWAELPAQHDANSWIGRGVGVGSVSQARDRFLEAQIPGSLAATARATAESNALASVHVLDPDLKGGLTASLGQFYSALRALSQNPGSSVLRQSAIDASRNLAMSFNRTAQGLADARAAVDRQLSGYMTEVNSKAAQMAELNRQISQARAAGGEPNDLLDARQRLQDRLAELTGAIPVPNGSGDISMALPDGTTLVSGDRAASLAAVPDPGNGGHVSLQVTKADGSGPYPSGTVGGTLGGLLDARDGALKHAEAGIDQLAFDLGNALNAVQQAGYGLDGVSGRPLFDVSTTAAGAASTLAVNAAVLADPGVLGAASTAAGVPGDATNLFRLIETEDAVLSSGLDPGAQVSAITSAFGASASEAKATSENEGAVKDHLIRMRESTSGVSVDEELVNLQKAQRAFEAVSKVITTSSAMLEVLMQLK
jgi:flagellar hook-associated protein 1 FlgK